MTHDFLAVVRVGGQCSSLVPHYHSNNNDNNRRRDTPTMTNDPFHAFSLLSYSSSFETDDKINNINFEGKEE
jgi:hypothetical protein